MTDYSFVLDFEMFSVCPENVVRVRITAEVFALWVLYCNELPASV